MHETIENRVARVCAGSRNSIDMYGAHISGETTRDMADYKMSGLYYFFYLIEWPRRLRNSPNYAGVNQFLIFLCASYLSVNTYQ